MKTFNGKSLERSSNVDDKVSIVNNNSGLLPRALTTLIQFQNTSILTDKKTIILSKRVHENEKTKRPVIRTMIQRHNIHVSADGY